MPRINVCKSVVHARLDSNATVVGQWFNCCVATVTEQTSNQTHTDTQRLTKTTPSDRHEPMTSSVCNCSSSCICQSLTGKSHGLGGLTHADTHTHTHTHNRWHIAYHLKARVTISVPSFSWTADNNILPFQWKTFAQSPWTFASCAM